MKIEHITADAETFTANVYLALGETTALIDAGAMPGTVDAIREHTDHIDAVYLTHQHADHVTQLDEVLDAFDTDLYAYENHPRRTHELQDGDTVPIGDEDFQVVHTPGHRDDHVAFVSETTIFSGDVVVHNDSAFDYGSFGKTEYDYQDREVLIDSIEYLLETLPDTVSHMYAGHGDVFHGDVRDVIETALERAKKREPKYPD